MKSLFVVLLMTVVCTSQENNYINIMNKYYERALDRPMLIAIPKFILYTDAGINLIYANYKYLIDNQFVQQKMERVKISPKSSRTYTDHRGYSIEYAQGEIFYGYNFKNVEVITKNDYKTYLMVPDAENKLIFFLAKPSAQNVDRGSLFVLDIDNVTVEERDLIRTQEISDLGSTIVTMGINSRTGALALAVKTADNWNLVVLTKSSYKPTTTTEPPPVETTTAKRKRPSTVPANRRNQATTTTTTTTTSTMPPPEEEDETVDVRANQYGSEVGIFVRDSLNKIRVAFENMTRSCETLERRTEILFKRYARTLELSGTDEDMLRKANLISPISRRTGDVSLNSVVDQIADEILAFMASRGV